MQVVVNHLTRMQPGYICVAGIDPQTGKHVRPVLVGRQKLRRDLLTFEHGPFNVAALVDIGPAQPVGSPPETEDHRFWPAHARLLRTLDDATFWDLLASTALASVTTIFGQSLTWHGHTYVVPAGKGTASLGCLMPRGHLALRPDSQGRLRLHTRIEGHDVALSVTDLRYYEDDQKTIRREAVTHTNTRLRAGIPCIFSLGLTRPWQKPGEEEELHWLQVNGIHLRDNPTWQAEASATTTLASILDELPF